MLDINFQVLLKDYLYKVYNIDVNISYYNIYGSTCEININHVDRTDTYKINVWEIIQFMANEGYLKIIS